MPPRVIPTDPTIGQRIKARRELRGWSMRQAADRAGISHASWSRIEGGTQRADRYLIADLAAALECSVADLTGQPPTPADRHLEAAHARVPDVWRALVDIAPDEPAERPAPPIQALRERAALIEDRRLRCDYAGVGQLLPDLLLDLHAATTGPDAATALRMLVAATNTARGLLTPLGYHAEATMAAERCRQAAEELGTPVELAVADRGRASVAMASGSYRRALTLSTRAADQLGRRLDVPDALAVLGALHLCAAMSVLAGRDGAAAFAHLDEADRLAVRTGATAAWSMAWGPDNVALWRMALLIDAGDPGRAVETARLVDPGRLEHADRRAMYYVDLARALADLGGRRDRDALRMLLAGERAAPQRVRSYPGARETARYLLDRSRRLSGVTELRGVCERLGVPM